MGGSALSIPIAPDRAAKGSGPHFSHGPRSYGPAERLIAARRA
jgi:hypothetical protein